MPQSMQQMASGQWPEPGTPKCLEHRQELARAWGCSESSIRNYSAEASRNLRADEGERDYLRIKNARRMRRIAKKAERTPSDVTGLPDWRAAIDAWDRYGRYLGLEPGGEDGVAPAAPPQIVIEYADERPADEGTIQPPAVGEASSDAAGVDGGDTVGSRSR